MAPKPQPKLTKKQLEEQKKEQARLQKIKEEEEAAAEKIRLQEQQKLREIELKKLKEEETIRIKDEKQKQASIMEERLRAQERAHQDLRENRNWENFTTQYHRDFEIDGTKLSTFLNMFKNLPYKNPETTLKECQKCEIYLQKLGEKCLEYRAGYNQKESQQCENFISLLQVEEMKKLQNIMIEYANLAEEMEEKNVEEAKKKNEQSGTQKIIKPIDNRHCLSQHFKLGMYINTLSTKNYNKFNPIGIKEFGFNTEVPSKWINNTSIVKFQWVSFDPFISNLKEQFRIVGGVFNLEFYDMFIGSKKTNNIAIKRFYKDKQILDKFKLPTSAIKEPFKLTYEIPSYVFLKPYLKTTLRIAQFDVSSARWVLLPNDSISDYYEQEKKIICKVCRPEPIALVEKRCIDYPYVAWELRTVDQGRVLLDIELQRFLNPSKEEYGRLMLQFDIGANIVKLRMDESYPQFSNLCSEYHTPEHLLQELSKRGVHLLPVDDEFAFAKLTPKDRQSEKCAIRDIAYAVESFTVRSENNSESDIKVKIRENLDNENIFLEDQEKDWLKIRWNEGGKCSVANRGVIERHLNLQTLLSEHQICERECVDKIKFDKNYLLKKTVMKILELTRILSFTTSEEKIQSTLVKKLKKKIKVSDD